MIRELNREGSMKYRFEEMSSAELRLEIAELEYERARSWNGIWRKQNRLNEVTAELLRRGSF